jgi:hypothetical protein
MSVVSSELPSKTNAILLDPLYGLMQSTRTARSSSLASMTWPCFYVQHPAFLCSLLCPRTSFLQFSNPSLSHTTSKAYCTFMNFQLVSYNFPSLLHIQEFLLSRGFIYLIHLIPSWYPRTVFPLISTYRHCRPRSNCCVIS